MKLRYFFSALLGGLLLALVIAVWPGRGSSREQVSELAPADTVQPHAFIPPVMAVQNSTDSAPVSLASTPEAVSSDLDTRDPRAQRERSADHGARAR